jgi:glycosidase
MPTHLPSRVRATATAAAACVVVALVAALAPTAPVSAASGVVSTIAVHVPGTSRTVPGGASVTFTGFTGSTSTVTATAAASDDYGWFALIAVPSGALTGKLSATTLTASAQTIDLRQAAEFWLASDGTPRVSLAAARGFYRVHAVTTATGPIKIRIIDGNTINDYATTAESGGAYADVPYSASSVTVAAQITSAGTGASDVLPFNMQQFGEAWISAGWKTARTSKAWADGFAVIHYKRTDGAYASWGLHTWTGANGGAIDPGWNTPRQTDASLDDTWGKAWKVPLIANSTELPYLVHSGGYKDPSYENQLLNLVATGGEIWVRSGAAGTDGAFIAQAPVPYGSTAAAPVGPTTAEASALASSSLRSSMASDRIYFVMTDRYANGTAANDRAGFPADSANWESGYDPYSDGYYHGGDLKGLTFGEPDPKTKKVATSCSAGTGLARIKNLGFTAIWITPPFKQKYVQGDTAAYHGYWIEDFTDIDPHWGTKSDFKIFVDCAHSLGMKVVMDIVVNHTADINSYDDGNKFITNVASPYRDVNGTALDLSKLMTTDVVPEMDANTSFPHTPFIPFPDEETVRAPEFLNDLTNYHNRGNVQNWGIKEQYQQGDFSGLDDIFTEKATVVQGFADVFANWVNTYGVDGFRIDTAKHVDDKFFTRWWPKVKAATAAKVPGLYAFGEVYENNATVTSDFVRNKGLPSVLDFPFQKTVIDYAAGNTAGTDVANLFNFDDDYTTTTTNAYGLTTFLDNHDMGRVGYLLSAAGVYDNELVGRTSLAFDMLYLLRGIPVVYYGDEVGMMGDGGDKAARQDMFKTPIFQWQQEPRLGTSVIGSKSSLQLTSGTWITKVKALAALRAKYPVLATGAQIPRYDDDQAFVVSRIDNVNRVEYLVGFNNSSRSVSVKVQTSTPSAAFKGVYGSTSTVKSDKYGMVKLSLPAKKGVLLQALSQLPNAATKSVSLSLSFDVNVKVYYARAALDTTDPSTVTFVWRTSGTNAWKVLGVDDAEPYRIVIDPQKFTSGSRIDVAAVAKSTSGSVSVSGVTSILIP